MLKKYIKKVTDRQDLSFEEMQQVFEIITTGVFDRAENEGRNR